MKNLQSYDLKILFTNCTNICFFKKLIFSIEGELFTFKNYT